MTKIKYFLILILSAATQSFALDAEHVLWDKTPIRITLPLHEERLVHFPQAISIVDNEAGDKIAILKIQDAIYIKGKEAFENKRLLVQLMPQGEVIILDVSVNETITSHKPIEILLDKKEAGSTPSETEHSFDMNAVTLTRFAIQSLYSPQRLLVIPPDVSRTPMQTRRYIQLMYGASVEARPLISWRGGNLYVTAIALKNLLNKEVILDPRQMSGNWQTATFYPTNTLAPRGREDSTTVLLVSDRPFHEALATGREFVR